MTLILDISDEEVSSVDDRVADRSALYVASLGWDSILTCCPNSPTRSGSAVRGTTNLSIGEFGNHVHALAHRYLTALDSSLWGGVRIRRRSAFQ